MNKKVILILLSVAMFSTVSHAQKVIKNGVAVIIDCSEMESKFYDATPKPLITTATNGSAGTKPAIDISSAENSAKVYKKFEVHKTDNSNGTNWISAIILCSTLDSDGTGWRLPTQRELMLMWVLKEKLVMATGFKAFRLGNYFSATEVTSIDDRGVVSYKAWGVSFSNGMTDAGSNNRTDSRYVRCIRDII